MNGSKTTSLQAYTLLVYRKAIHPEFFQIEARKRIEHPQYEFEGWVFKGGHAGRFQFGELCLCEVVVEGGQNLPEKGLVTMWTDEAGKPNLSLLDMQRLGSELHIQGYHLRSDCSMVLRTQSMFQVALNGKKLG